MPSEKKAALCCTDDVLFFARELSFPTMGTGNFLDIQQATVSYAARKGAAIAQEE